jgi:hypothetical protein
MNRERLSRLSLAVVVGVLESLVEATPTRIGHTYLRSLQETLHPVGWDGKELPYYSFARLTDVNMEDLTFWLWLLRTNKGRWARSTRAGTLIPAFGDGSGTGTGGTVQYTEEEPLEMWMGIWSARVYHFSSNWKELRTLLATLERAAELRRTDIRGVTFFYFTDNTTTYYAVSSGASTSPGLHAMVRKIKMLEIEVECTLEVVHVPGTTLITQSTDGLSRGVWGSPLHDRPSQLTILSEIFSPVPFSPDVQQWALNQVGLPFHPCRYMAWSEVWDPSLVFDRLTVWTPPPEVASQLLYFLLQCHVEKPLTTAMIVILPRVLQRRWSRASRHVREIGVYQRHEVPFVFHSYLTIPVVILFIPFHVPMLPEPRLDPAPPTASQRLHRQHATLMRGVHEAFGSP